MYRAWLVMLLSGMMGLAVPALALAQAEKKEEGKSAAQPVYVTNPQAEVLKEEGKYAGYPVYLMNLPPPTLQWLAIGLLVVAILLLALVSSQLGGIKAALEKFAKPQ